MIRGPIRYKQSLMGLPQRKERKRGSSKWNWISDRLEQPVQSRENFIPPVLFTRPVLIRCEETAGREQRVSAVPGEGLHILVIFRGWHACLMLGAWGRWGYGLPGGARTGTPGAAPYLGLV